MTVATYLFLSVITAVLIPILGTTCYYLGYWARVTEKLWSKYPNWLSKFMHCAACSGTWDCLAVGTCLWVIGFPFMGLPGGLAPPFEIPGFWLVKYGTLPAMAFWGTFWVPILANKHLAALRDIGEHEDVPSAVAQPEAMTTDIVNQPEAPLAPLTQPEAPPVPVSDVGPPVVVEQPKKEATPERKAKWKESMAKARAAKLAKATKPKGTSKLRTQ